MLCHLVRIWLVLPCNHRAAVHGLRLRGVGRFHFPHLLRNVLHELCGCRASLDVVIPARDVLGLILRGDTLDEAPLQLKPSPAEVAFPACEQCRPDVLLARIRELLLQRNDRLLECRPAGRRRGVGLVSWLGGKKQELGLTCIIITY